MFYFRFSHHEIQFFLTGCPFLYVSFQMLFTPFKLCLADFCLISEGGITSFDKLLHKKGLNEFFANIAKLTIQFVKKNSLV